MGGKRSTPKVEEMQLPAAATPAPPPEETAQALSMGDDEEGALRHKDRDAKKKGTGSLRIDLNVKNTGSATPGAGGGLSIPRG